MLLYLTSSYKFRYPTKEKVTQPKIFGKMSTVTGRERMNINFTRLQQNIQNKSFKRVTYHPIGKRSQIDGT